MTLGEYIKAYREEHRISQREFARLCGFTNGYISMLENGKNSQTGRPIKSSIGVYKAVASAVGLTTGDLLAMLDDAVSLEMPGRTADNVQTMPALRNVPRLGAIACGTPVLAQSNIEGYDAVPDYINCDFTLVCKGDSMTGARVCDGDIVCIRQQEPVDNGQIAAVLIDDETECGSATLKRVRFGTDGSLILWPENPNYPPMVFTGADVNRVHILGIATHFISVVR